MVQYIYYVSCSSKNGIIEESLKFYPDKRPILVYKRKGRKITEKNSEFFNDETQSTSINPKRLYLSELGNSGNEKWENLRNYFTIGNSVVNFSTNGMGPAINEQAKKIFESNDPEMILVKNKVIKLIQLSDLGIQNMDLVEEIESVQKQKETSDTSDESYTEQRKQKRFKTLHNVYNNKEKVATKELDLYKQGSTGTIALVGLSAEIIMSLSMKNHRPLWVDEIDNSMHPYMCRFIISLFNHPKTNTNNSQLIFATHETTLLDKSNFRKDQIWITSKDEFGVTKLYSVHDLGIEGIRDDIPFDKWYMSGKFGGLPKIKEMDIIFNRD